MTASAAADSVGEVSGNDYKWVREAEKADSDTTRRAAMSHPINGHPFALSAKFSHKLVLLYLHRNVTGAAYDATKGRGNDMAVDGSWVCANQHVNPDHWLTCKTCQMPRTGAGQAVRCQLGHLNPAGTRVCHECNGPIGRYCSSGHYIPTGSTVCSQHTESAISSAGATAVCCQLGHFNPTGTRVCHECNGPIEAVGNYCPAGHGIPTGADFCAQCGRGPSTHYVMHTDGGGAPSSSRPTEPAASSSPLFTDLMGPPLTYPPPPPPPPIARSRTTPSTPPSPPAPPMHTGYSPPRNLSTPAQPAAPLESRKKRLGDWWRGLSSRGRLFTVLGLIGALCLLFFGGCSAFGLTSAEKKYLDALKYPCQHPEVFSNVADGDRSYCAFTWDTGGSNLVAEGHRICALKADNPQGDAPYRVPYNHIMSAHPSYSRVQINTQLIAAEKLLC
jgi:hypothetical protein